MPNSWQSISAVVPMPLVPPWINARWPLCAPPRPNKLAHTVKGFWHGSGLNPVHAFRNRQGLAGGYGAELCIAATIGQGTDLVAQAVFIDAVAQRNHFAGHFQARYRAHAGFHWVLAGALQGIGTINPGGMHADQNFAGAGRGHCNLTGLENLGAAEGGDFNLGHVVGQSHVLDTCSDERMK